MPLDLSKVPPGLVDLSKKASVSLTKQGLSGQRAAVYLVLDHSGSMTSFYSSGAVQKLAEQALGLSANLDDDGTVPLVYFHYSAESAVDVSLSDYAGVVDRTSAGVAWGSTDYVSAMYAVTDHYQKSGATDPALVIFQTDGAPNDRPATERALKDVSGSPLFWSFVGFGPARNMTFLEKLDTLRVGIGGRKVDNASFFHAENPRTVRDEDLYDGITHEFAGWLTAARSKGIVR